MSNKSLSECLENLISDLQVEQNGFDDINRFQDTEYGFSARKKLDINDIANKEYYSILRVLYSEKKFSIEGNKKSLEIRLDFSYKDKDGDYILPFVGRKTNKSPTTVFSSEVYYDIEKRKFFKNSNEIVAKKLLNNLYNAHLKPTKTIRGFPFRTRLSLFLFTIVFLKCLERFFSLVYYLLCGVKHKDDLLMHKEDQKLTSSISKDSKAIPNINVLGPEKSSILGYKGSRWILSVYASVHLVIYFLPFTKPNKVKFIFTNIFLTAIYVFVTLGIYEFAVPRFFIWLIKKVSNKRFSLAFKEIHIKV